eukprot:gene20789-22827_t
MDELKSMLMKHFVMKDMGPLHYILGIGCIQEESRIGLTQNAYIEKLVDKYGLTEAKPVSTPSDPNVVLQKDDGFSKPVHKTMFQSLVGSLLYAALGTRPDIQYAVSNVAKYSAAPTQAHLNAAKRVLRYLKGTKNFALWYCQTDGQVIGYSDADFARNKDDRHSVSGYVFMLRCGAISCLVGEFVVIETLMNPRPETLSNNEL